MSSHEILHKPLVKVIEELPLLIDFFKLYQIDASKSVKSFLVEIEDFNVDYWETNQTSRHELIGSLIDLVTGIEKTQAFQKIETLEVLAGNDKNNNPENCSLLLKPGEITCIVGPTGSGKSRLLADIEWLADKDTPTRRQILINGKAPDDELKNNFGGKLIAQITQNMNFVLDMDVESFLLLHAQSLFLENAPEKVEEVITLANDLSGESFSPTTPITFLSGGQSRALMIADVACIGRAPIVLIDEIENAGVDKKKALDLLISQEKIVLMATHDPLLILQADKRVVIQNGGMIKIINTTEHERAFYYELEKIDSSLQMARNFFRQGNSLNSFDSFYTRFNSIIQ